MPRSTSFKSIAEAARLASPRMAKMLLGEPVWTSKEEWRWRKNLSLSLCVFGDNLGRWRDFESGEHGDILDLVQMLQGLSLRDAARWVADQTGVADRTTVVEPSSTLGSSRPEKLVDARQIWDASSRLSGSLAETYLRFRLCGAPLPTRVLGDDSLRYCAMMNMPARRRFSGPCGAMIAKLVDPKSNEFRGVQRTFLDAHGRRFIDRDGTTMTARLLGSSGVVKLWDDAEVSVGLALGEGIETCLSAYHLLGGPPVWATLSASTLSGFPPLAGIEAVTLYVDADLPDKNGRRAGEAAAASLVARWRSVAPRVEFVRHLPRRPGEDFNDLLQHVSRIAA